MASELFFSAPLLYYISEWVVRLVMLGIVIDRHPLRSAMTWLLVIFFLPWPGLVLYLFIGENRLPRRRLRQRRALMEKLEGGRPHYMKYMGGASSAIEQTFLPTITLAEKLGHMPTMLGNQATLLADTQRVIDRLIEDIDAAQHHVHLLFYIFSVDETGQRVCAALERAAARGVACRVLVDEFFPTYNQKKE